MFRKIITIIILGSMGIVAYPQLQPLLDQYLLNGMAINPGYAGSQEALNIGIYERVQWVGFEGAPRTFTFSAHTPLRDKKVGLGIIVLNDKIGSRSETGFILNYAYRIKMGVGKLSFGLAAGLTNLSTDIDLVRYTNIGDGLLVNEGFRATMPEFSFGLYYYSKKFFAGLSVPFFSQQSFDEANYKYKIGFDPLSMNYLFLTGYQFSLSDNYELVPSLLFKTNPSNNTQLDLNCNIIYREKLWIGTSFRTNKNMAILFQIQANSQLRIAYSYGHEFSELSSFQKGSHEVILNYSFKYKLDVFSPRYF